MPVALNEVNEVHSAETVKDNVKDHSQDSDGSGDRSATTLRTVEKDNRLHSQNSSFHAAKLEAIHPEKKFDQDFLRFLRDKERKACIDGFLDSRRYQTSYALRLMQEERQRKREANSNSSQPLTVVELAAQRQQSEADLERKLSTIEKYMIQHKTTSRELKQRSGEIAKSQREVRQVLRDYETAVAEKQLQEERQQQAVLENYSILQRQETRNLMELNKARAEKLQADQKAFKDKDRKVHLQTSILERRYTTKAIEVELKKKEVSRLAADFEKKLKLKEEEQHRLKREMVELAIALNMEAQKSKEEEQDYDIENKKDKDGNIARDLDMKASLDNKLSRSALISRKCVSAKRRLSLDLANKTSVLEAKQREEARRKTDTELRLAENESRQKALLKLADETESKLRLEQSKKHIEEHNARKKEKQESWLSRRREKSAVSEIIAEQYQERQTQQKIQDLNDQLNEYKRAVTNAEAIEQSLSEKVKAADTAHRDRERSIIRLQHRLMEAKRVHAAKLREEAMAFNNAETKMDQSLLRERAELSKLFANREDAYVALQMHREHLRHDRTLVTEYARERDRLLRIMERKSHDSQ